MSLPLHFDYQWTGFRGERFIQLDNAIAVNIGFRVLVKTGFNRLGAAQHQRIAQYRGIVVTVIGCLERNRPEYGGHTQ